MQGHTIMAGQLSCPRNLVSTELRIIPTKNQRSAHVVKRSTKPGRVICKMDSDNQPKELTRRREAVSLLGAVIGATALHLPQPAEAVQGMTAGRVPGLTAPDENGLRVYTRPAGKSGGHGVGWSEIPPYSFTVPETWKETPTSIADLGGTEVDLRFTDELAGDLAVVVAPVLRFIDAGFNAQVTIEEIGTPEKVIRAFGPEITGHTIEDEDILSIGTFEADGLTYYSYDLRPHMVVSAAAFRNRLYICTLQSNSAQWRKSKGIIGSIRDSFRISVDSA